MKRFVLCVILSLGIAIAIFGCQSDISELNKQSASIPGELSNESSSSDNCEAAAITENVNDTDTLINVIECTFSMKYDLVTVSISFPQLSGCQNQALEDKVNKQIYEYLITDELVIWSNERNEVIIDYEITCINSEVLSVVFSGCRNNRGNYSDYDTALTFDLLTGDKLSLTEVLSSETLLLLFNDKMLSDECSITDDALNKPEYKSDFKPIFEARFLNFVDYAHDDDFYIKEDTIGLIASVSPLLQQNVYVEFRLSD